MASISYTPPAPLASMAPTCAVGNCLHCGSALPSGVAGYCCLGCETVAGALREGGLLRYYDLRGERAEPVGDLRPERRDLLWIEPLVAQVAQADAPITLRFAVQGMRCAACVWLIQELFARAPGGEHVLVNPGRGTLSVRVTHEFPLRQFIADVERFGYLLGPHTSHARVNTDDLLVRLGVTAALGANVMMFSLAGYLGLTDGPLFRFLHTLSFGLTSLSVLIGAPLFVRSAWQAVRARLWHLDVPIAVGIALTYTAACWSFISGNTQAAYYDSLAIFIALMLLGRYLQTRAVAENQRRLLSSTGADAVMTRRVTDGRVTLIAASEIHQGDTLLISAGDLVPVDCVLVAEQARCSLDWITGESDPITYAKGAIIPSGAFNVDDRAWFARANEAFADSALRELLATPERDEDARRARNGHAFARVYVPSVLLAAVGGLLAWWWKTGSIETGLSVATAVCVVTCPCAIGIATPLAHDLVLGRLRRAGLFVRSATLLERLSAITRVVFDKTGTLTTGRLRLTNERVLDTLDAEARDALYTLCASSVHPKSVALHRALGARGGRLVSGAEVVERAGQGVSARIHHHDYRLGRRSFVTGSEGDALTFGRDDEALITLSLDEDIRHDSAQELHTLDRLGYETWILSGDQPARVAHTAQVLGVDAARALGGQSPGDKAAWIQARDQRDTLMIGDGINDSLAVREAYCSGTPSIDRAFMPGRTDFYFVTAGLSPITLALSLAKRLSRVTRINQVFAVSYNVGAVALCLAGAMRPWMAAVLMPLSSLAVLSWTTALIKKGER